MTDIARPRPWEADPRAVFARRLGKPPTETDPVVTEGKLGSPDIWALSNGDVAVIGRDLTDSYASCLPEGVGVAPDERIVVIPHATIVAAKKDIPDA